jgi:N-acylneuraminate cytidylyltransferase/CMP-N,N'-diacetyllegionaminic acid synthase
MHVLDEYEKNDMTFTKLIILLPTSPFRSAYDISESNRIFDKQRAAFLMSVSEFDHNPFGALKYKSEENEIMIPCFPEHIGKKRHEVPETYRANGAVCIVNVRSFRDAGTYYGNPLYTYRMPWYRGIDVDTESDLKFAEFLLSSGKINEKKL